MASTHIATKTESNRRTRIRFTLPIFVVECEHIISNNFLQSHQFAPKKPSKTQTAPRNRIIGNCDFGAGPHSEKRTYHDWARTAGELRVDGPNWSPHSLRGDDGLVVLFRF